MYKEYKMKIRSLIILIVLIVLFLIPSLSFSNSPITVSTSGEQTADAAIMESPGVFYGVIVMPDGSHDVTVSIYDNASAASGTKILPTLTFAGDGGAQAFAAPYPIRCRNGIYVDITTAGTVAYVILRGTGQ